MNKDEWIALIGPTVAILAPIAAKYGVDANTLTAALTGLVGIVITLYVNWNQRKVHETAVVTGTAPTVAIAKAQSIPAGK